MARTDAAKLKILELIRDNKYTLFGAFSKNLTKNHKNNAWNKIFFEANAMGLVPAGKDVKYIRDTLWQQLRRRTVEKLDNRNRTGAAGGEHMRFDDMDNLVIDIIGNII